MHVAVRADSFHRKPNTSSKDNNPSLSVRREHSEGIRNLEKKTFSLSFSEEEVTPTGENRDGLVHLRKDSVVSTNEPEKKSTISKVTHCCLFPQGLFLFTLSASVLAQGATRLL